MADLEDDDILSIAGTRDAALKQTAGVILGPTACLSLLQTAMRMVRNKCFEFDPKGSPPALCAFKAARYFVRDGDKPHRLSDELENAGDARARVSAAISVIEKKYRDDLIRGWNAGARIVVVPGSRGPGGPKAGGPEAADAYYWIHGILLRVKGGDRRPASLTETAEVLTYFTTILEAAPYKFKAPWNSGGEDLLRLVNNNVRPRQLRPQPTIFDGSYRWAMELHDKQRRESRLRERRKRLGRSKR